jgi:hypothetical protein
MDSIPTLAGLCPTAHLVLGTMPEPCDEATALGWLEALYNLLQRLQLTGAYGVAIERQCGSWFVRCAFAAEADAIAVAQAVQACVIGRPSAVWSSERAFEADRTRLGRLVSMTNGLAQDASP